MEQKMVSYLVTLQRWITEKLRGGRDRSVFVLSSCVCVGQHDTINFCF